MTTGFDAESLRMNNILEFTHATTRSTIQGTLVAGFTGEDMVAGALKGGLYGSISTALTIWFLGTRYFPFKDYDPEDVDAMIEAENNFQNDHGRGGTYEIDRQMIFDSNFRVNGALPDIISASITLPGNVSMSNGGFYRLPPPYSRSPSFNTTVPVWSIWLLSCQIHSYCICYRI